MSGKSNVDANHIMAMDTPEAVYLLGFIWGDGYLLKDRNTIRIECVKEDIDEILNIFNSFGKWSYSCRQRINRKEQCTIETRNNTLMSFLLDFNYGNKSGGSFDTILNTIPKELLHYWIRGLFDADGCFYFNPRLYLRQMSIASNFNQDWNKLEFIFNDLNIKYRINRRSQINKLGIKNSSSIIRCSDKNSIDKFGKFIYDGKDFGLSRKKDKYLQIING